MSLKTYLTWLQSKTPDRLFCISPPQSPSTTFTNTPVSSGRRCIVQSHGLLLLRRDKRQRRKFESHPTHDFLPLKQRLWLRSIFLRLKDVPKMPPKIILRDPKRDCASGKAERIHYARITIKYVHQLLYHLQCPLWLWIFSPFHY